MQIAVGALALSEADNVAVACRRLVVGEPLAEGVVVSDLIEPGHKVALGTINKGAAVLKFGQMIGCATTQILPGQHVHSHNLAFERGLTPGAPQCLPAMAADMGHRVFHGYRRATGMSATRNFIGIIASVNCSTTVCRVIAEEANRTLLHEFPGVDGFVPIVHGQGCGTSGDGEGQKTLHRTIAGYARHPNFGAVLMIGLGCEVNQLTLYGQKGAGTGRHHFNIQESGGSRHSVKRALAMLAELAQEAGRARREPISVAELVVGLQCGGSDGLSGVTANPALGVAMDILVAAGGTAILSETPEIYGAEHLLTARATRPEIAQKLTERIRWWEDYVAVGGASLDNNPSPGNKRGGLTTILEKSLGAVAKAGHSPLNGVYGYAERVSDRGLVFMDTPGYDPVSATGQVAGGANVIAFTTGRGSCFGCRPVPSLKLASNSALYQSMPDDMDIDCGAVVSEGKSLDKMGAEIFERIVAIASGQKTHSEEFGYGDNEFVPWQLGVTL